MLQLFPSLAYAADALTRKELCAGTITDERVYMASWLARIRDWWTLAGGTAYLHARAVGSAFETNFGVDAIIVFHVDGKTKGLAIEAKNPDLAGIKPNRRVDSLVGKESERKSRYTAQLESQKELLEYGLFPTTYLMDNAPLTQSIRDALGGLFLFRSHMLGFVPEGKALWTRQRFLNAIGGPDEVNVSWRNTANMFEQFLLCGLINPRTDSQAIRGERAELTEPLESYAPTILHVDGDEWIPDPDGELRKAYEAAAAAGSAAKLGKDLASSPIRPSPPRDRL